MRGDGWRHLVDLFESVVKLPASERAAWLDAHCLDPGLRARVEAMVEGDEGSVPLLDRPEELFALESGGDLLESAGDRIGPYVLGEILGEGGMGAVWAGEQEEPIRRSVAIKLIKPGMDTRRMLARFAAERQALARMEHPHIAVIHDAGVTGAGRPYFVMQRVDGDPITTWCNARGLDLGDRIELFLPVCEAVQHAHHKGVIHRDLKPSNVLVSEVDGRAHPMVIDFGIAKLMEQGPEEGVSQTRLGARVGTPSYMSPEQLAGGEVDTRSDVYSLGALLYTLLVGEPPLELGALTPDEAAREARERTPPTPSRRIPKEQLEVGAGEVRPRVVPREIDWIVMKALEKLPDRRYATPRELAADLRRFLSSQPVQAGPPSKLYRAQTFVRRHRLAVLLTSVALFSLLSGLAGTIWMAIEIDRARRESERARTEAQQEATSARAVSDFLTDVLSAADPLRASGGVPGREVRVSQILTRALARLDEDRGEDPEVRAKLRGVLGRTFLELDMFDEAESALEQALAEHRNLFGASHPETLRHAAERARLHLAKGEYEPARELIEPTLEASNRELGAEHPDTLAVLSLAGEVRVTEGRVEEAERIYRQLLDASRRHYGEEHANTVAALNDLAVVLRRRDQRTEATRLFRRILEINRRTLGPAHPYTVRAVHNLGVHLFGEGELDEAEALVAEALRLTVPIHGEDGERTVNIRSTLAAVRYRQGRLEEAVRGWREAAEGFRRLFGSEHPQTLRVLNNLARGLAEQGSVREAIDLYEDLLPTTDRVLPAGHSWRAMFRAGYGKVLYAAGDHEQARIELAAAVPGLQASVGATHPQTVSAAEILAELDAQ